MPHAEPPRGTSTLLLLPPYETFTPIDEVQNCCERGVAVVWTIHDSAAQQSEWEWLSKRPPSVALVLVLPPPVAIRRVLPMLREASSLRPRGVLPNNTFASPEPVRMVLASAPRDLAAMAVSHFSDQGILRDQRIRGLVSRVFELAPAVPSISKLARKLYTSRRTLGRCFEAEGLPVPSHWLQLARLLYVSALIQEKPNVPVAKAAIRVGYPDGFTMSNQMKRLIGCRPSDVRDNLGLSWILEEWIHRERSAGRLEWHGYTADTCDVEEWVDKHPARRTA